MVEHLSYSSISLYLSCPAAWKFRYVDKVEIPTSPNLIFGNVFHDTVEDYIKSRKNIVELWGKAWDKRTRGMKIEWATDTPEQHYNKGIKMITNDEVIKVLGEIKPRVDADGMMIERKINLRIDGVGVPIIGFIDCIEEERIADFKTSSGLWSESKAPIEMQPLVYFAACEQMGIAHTWKFRHYVFTKQVKPQVQIIDTQRNAQEVELMFGVIRGVWQGIEGKFFDDVPQKWKCNAKFCEYWGMCRGKTK